MDKQETGEIMKSLKEKVRNAVLENRSGAIEVHEDTARSRGNI